MRYFNISEINFTDINGKNYPIKDIRPIPEYSIIMKLRVGENDFIDEIASRDSVYGKGGYRNAYKIFDQNRIKMVENKLDMGKIRVLEIPS